MRTCACGQEVGDIRLQDGSRQAVEPCPIPYLASDQGRMELITPDGRVVRAISSPPAHSQGIGYPRHRCVGRIEA